MPRYRNSHLALLRAGSRRHDPVGRAAQQGVTLALHELEGRGLIKGTRNQIMVVDRDGLLGLANGFYGVPEAEYDRTIRPRRAPRRA